MTTTVFEENLLIYLKQHEKYQLSSLATQSNISRQTFYNILNNKHQIKLSSAIKIAQALNIDFIKMNEPEIFNDAQENLLPFDESINASDILLIFTQNIKRILNANSKFQLALSTVPGISTAEISNVLNRKVDDPLLITLETISFQSGFNSLAETFKRR